MPFQRSKGLTFISILLILALISFFTLLLLKIAPIYINHGRVASVLAALETDPNLLTMSKTEISTSINKRFNINYVEDVSEDNIQIIAQPGYVNVVIDYQPVKPLFANLSVLVDFHDEIEVGSR